MFYRSFVRGRSPLYRALPRRGPLALITVFGPYLVWLLVLAFARSRRLPARILRPVLVTIAAAYVARSSNRRAERCATPGAQSFSVMSWNMLFWNPQTDAVMRLLASEPADVIALQELTVERVEMLSTDPELCRIYPHRIIWSYGVGGGMGLLSRYPIVEQGKLEIPPVIWARLDLGDGRTVVIVSAHPTFGPTLMVKDENKPKPSPLERIMHIIDLRFLWYDPDHRDDGIGRVRVLIDQLLQHDEVLLLVGDFNVTEREHAYDVLTAGLQDAFLVAGTGNRNTWRPERMAHLPLPLLRIDYLLSGPGLRPLRMWVDPTPRGSDHCVIHGVFEVLPAS